MEGKQLYEYAMGTNKVTLIKRSGINKVASINGQKKFSLPLSRVKANQFIMVHKTIDSPEQFLLFNRKHRCITMSIHSKCQQVSSYCL